MSDRTRLPLGTIPEDGPAEYVAYHRESGYALDSRHHDPLAQHVKDLLLEHGGWSVVIPLASSVNELAAELARGSLQNFGTRYTLNLNENLSHAYAGLLFLLDQRRAGIGTGFALAPDGVWRSHFWAVRRENGLSLYEPAHPRVLYFGRTITGEEALRVAAIETATMNLRNKRLPTFDEFVIPKRCPFD